MGAVKTPSYLTLNEWLNTNNIDVKINRKCQRKHKANSINLHHFKENFSATSDAHSGCDVILDVILISSLRYLIIDISATYVVIVGLKASAYIGYI